MTNIFYSTFLTVDTPSLENVVAASPANSDRNLLVFLKSLPHNTLFLLAFSFDAKKLIASLYFECVTYILIKFLGKGQFGEVWLAEKQLQFSSRKFRHALKFLSNIGDEINLKAAEAEIDTWIEASGHPNVMSVLDMLVSGGHIIIVSEFAEGGSLKNWLSKNGGKAPSDEKALEMMAGILRGIEHLHSRNVVHRDLKPDNILLQGNFPRITDFGISRIVAEGTLSTKPIGSPAYMSPDSFKGSKSPQTDIWSAGVLLYEMLSGDFPFGGETIYGLIAAIQQDEPKPLPEYVPQELRKIVENALQKDTNKRFQTAREMRLAVERAIYNLKVKAEENIIKEDFEEVTPTQSIIDFDDKPEQISKEITEEPPEEQPEPVITQPKIEIVQETQPSPIEETRDAEELEREKQLERERELAQISEEADKNRAKRLAEHRKRKFWIAGGIGGGILGLSLIGFLIASMIGNNQTQTNSNVAEKLANTSTSEKTKDTQPEASEIEMVRIPAGSFMMGSNNGDDDERPVHKVIISRDFWMGKYEVTQAQWQAVMGNNPSSFSNCGGKCPVENVSWDDAQDFIRRLNSLQNDYKYRLPTEAEWEYACRAGTTGDYAGNLDSMVWYSSNSGSKTHLVGTKQPNAWGLYDMHGNVWEWVQDWFDKDYYSRSPTTDPTGPNSGSLRVFRGGGWGGNAVDLRSANRYSGAPSFRSGILGFRVVRQ